MPPPVVAIFGSGSPRPGDPSYETAREIAARLARRGWVIANGGYGGTMEASARGAREAGGQAIGVTCFALGRSGPNRYITEARSTETLYDRLRTLIEISDAYLALPGATGTAAELVLAWELQHKRLIASKPLLAWSPHWDGLLDCILTTGEPRVAPRRVRSADEVVEALADPAGGG